MTACADGSAAMVNGQVVDLDSGASWQIPGVTGANQLINATLLLR
jgi:hypothetical protein